ncbi:SUMF1/EgtB/PvdO family nonheme iron enzyme [Streptomyces sp. NPDC096193]|uniref:SUMF1/EgtB/PvdO family nonheme iron enzyme n=1 Tax=Streptomyces sp. NPDC096193 TaxID=3155821 RepID=UPI00332EA091
MTRGGRGAVRRVGQQPDNSSPFGVVGMAGNCWEWTSTSLSDAGEAVICGGSYDNPMRAVQAGSKGLYRKRGGSNAVGLRCVEDITGVPGTERTGR